LIGDGYRAGVSASPSTVAELTALRADNERLSAEREHYRDLYLQMLEQNWLFVGNDDAGEVNAAFVSLLASCRLHGIEPWSYLRDLFCLTPSWPRSRVLELAPVQWRQTLTRPEVLQRLHANVYRRASLAPVAASRTATDAAR
jgi:hypothetical protein